MPLANVAAAQQQLLAQLQEFNRYAAKPASRLAVLEALREAVQFVEIEQARRFTNRALPMAEAESRGFRRHARALGRRCAWATRTACRRRSPAKAGMRGQAALVCQRAARSTRACKMFHYHRAYRQVPPREWRALHEAYARAEELERRRRDRSRTT